MSKPNAWQVRSPELVEHWFHRLPNRLDRYGGYYRKRGEAKSRKTTRPTKGPQEGCVTVELLRLHCEAATVDDLIGFHALGRDSRGRWLAVDIDAHGGPGDDPEKNRRYAVHLHARLTALGLTCLLYESDGKGGFHLYVFFDAPVPGDLLHSFGRWLVADHAAHGLDVPPEVFPKQKAIGEKGYGNWLRTPGKHHTEDHWPRVFDGGRWLEDAAAVAFVLGLTPNSPGLIPPEAYPARETKAAPGPVTAPNWVLAGGTKPGHAFDDAADWRALLEADGARLDRDGGDGVSAWTRPGKDDGVSATVGYCRNQRGTPLLYVFSSNWHGLEAGRGYTPFQFVTAKRFGRVDAGACSEMAKELRRGTPRPDAGGGATAPPEGASDADASSGADAAPGPEGGEKAAPDGAKKADAKEEKKGRPAAADRMVELAHAAGVKLFHTPDHEAFAQVPVNDHTEVYPVKGTQFRRWLAREFFQAEGRAANGEAMQTALGTLEGIAAFACKEHPVHLRVAAAPDGGIATLAAACPTCHRPTDEKRRCWHCHDRACEGCGRQTGSAFIANCWPCQHAMEQAGTN